MISRFFGTLALALALAICAGGGAAAVAGGYGTMVEDGAWWLRSPQGGRFFSIGANTVNGGDKATAARGYYWEKRYPDPEAWARAAGSRLRAWGFNTRGGWSDPTPAMDLPLVPEIDLGRNSRLHWFDPFAPEALSIVVAKARELTGPYRDNPLVMGFFTDNEVGWWNAPLFKWYLANEWAIYAKRVVWGILHEHYKGDFARLSRDFVPKAGIASFEDLKAGGAELKLRPGGGGIHVIDRVNRVCARRYYSLVHAAMRQVAPDVLVMGDRLPLYYHQDAVLAARGHVDVLSTNYNVDVEDGWVAPYYFEGLAKLIEAPVLVSEFFFAAAENRSGNKNNGHLMHVSTQAQRARGAAAAQRHFAAFPNVVGTHWFQYYDEPTGGRGDGEDFNMGLVDIDDRPYEELTAALAAANREAWAIHAQGRFEKPMPRGEAVRTPRAKVPPRADDGSLLDWPDKAGTRLRGFETPEPYVPFGDVHLAWSPEGLHLFNLAGNYVDLFLLDYQGEFPASEAYQLHLEIEAGGVARHFAARLLPRPHGHYAGRFELEPRLYEIKPDGSEVRLDEKGRLQALDRPLPHIAVELFLPAGVLGFETFKPGDGFRARIWVTNFYRELTMRFDGGPVSGLKRDAERRLARTFVLAE